jgi:hypothetical protein
MVVTVQALPSWNKALAFVAGGIGCVAVANVVTASLDPSNYFYYWPSQMAEWKYPIRGVVVTVGLVIVETLVAFAVLAKYRRGRIWMRGLVALCLLVPLALYAIMFIVHSPIYHIIHVVYAWALVLLVSVAILCSGVVHIVEVTRRARQPRNHA